MNEIPFNKEKSYYLLVGVGKREEDSDAMAVSAGDAIYIKRALHAFDLFSEEKIAPIVNVNANRLMILSQLDKLAENTKHEPADLVIVFFSGHGSVVGGKYYLICRDTQKDDIANTAIEGALFVEKLKAIQCDKMLVLLDCCHAAGMTDIPFDKDTILSAPNRVILTACGKNQVSYLSSPASIFTYAVIEALGGKFLNGKDDKEVSIFNLAMDVRERVVALSEQVLKPDEIQKPGLNVLEKSGTSNFVLARYPLGGPREIKLFSQEFASLKSYEGKDLDMDVKNKRDVAERNNFEWLVSNNTIINNGNGNYTVLGSIIHNGISEDALKDILNHSEAKDKIIADLVAVLKKQDDPGSKELLIKVKKNNIAAKYSALDQLRKNIIDTLIKKRFLILEEIENESGNTKISLKSSLMDNTEKLIAYGIDVDDLGKADINSLHLA